MDERPEDRDEEGVDEGAAAEPPPGAPETGESGGFGLTEEFNRIEAEIENELGKGQGTEPGEPEAGAGVEQGPEQPEAPAAEEPEEPEEEAGEPQAEEPPAEVEEVEQTEEPEPEEPEPEEPGGSEEPEPVEQPTEVAEPVPEPAASEHPLITPMPRPTPIAVASAIPDQELEEKTPRLWLSFLVGSILIILSMASATTAFGLIFFTEIARELSDNQIKGVDRIITPTDGGDPQTILLIGSDKRSSDPGAGARSDTTMLLRVDPEKEALALFSLPRDLLVEIPGYGEAKLNEAFSLGGPKLTLKTVRQLTDPPLEINHLVRIDFEGFGEAVNAIGCVYVDIDRDYFSDGSQGYAEIDLNPGYQRLCGQDALDYVRYRHTDTDIVRAARQQDFLREARQKVPTRELVSPLGDNELIDIFTEYTESDINSAQEIIGILKSFLGVIDAPVTEVHFEGDIGDATNTNVTATDEQINSAIDQFLGVEGSEGPRGGRNSSDKPAEADKAGEDKETKDEPKDEAKDEPKNEGEGGPSVIAADPKFGLMANTVEREFGGLSGFYPSVLDEFSAFDRVSRTYQICVEGPVEGECRETEDAYKMVIRRTTNAALPEYYGVMGTTWEDPPILRNPSETRVIDDREYMLFYDNDRLRLVGFKFEGNSYWVNNTLTQSVSEADMLEIATTMKQSHYKPKDKR